MSRRPIRSIPTRRTIRPGSRVTRIRIPQPPDRTLVLTEQTLRREAIRPEPWWFTLHRRGVYRPTVGVDPREARAVSRARVRGTLPERILYKKHLNYRLIVDVDFNFQSSLQGGRLELGGIVADFIEIRPRIVIRVQGPTHSDALMMQKDEDQKQILEAMGYWVVDITDREVYNEQYLDTWFHNLLGYGKYGGGMLDHAVANTGNSGLSSAEEDEDLARLVAPALPRLVEGIERIYGTAVMR